jgi:hypothetical protein
VERVAGRALAWIAPDWIALDWIALAYSAPLLAATH